MRTAERDTDSADRTRHNTISDGADAMDKFNGSGA